MQHWKYIMLDMPMSGDTIFIFPPHFSHADMKRAFDHVEVLSAGFVKFDETEKKFVCYGKSDSLGIGSRPDDAWFASKLLNPFDL